jgi:hypothetical protein
MKPSAKSLTVAAILAGASMASPALAGYFGSIILNPGQTQLIRTGLPAMNMRVCNDFFSTGGALVTVAGNAPHDLLPGRCAEDIGDQFLIQNQASGQVTIDYRSIQSNQGRRMQEDD